MRELVWWLILSCGLATTALGATIPNAGFEQANADGGVGPANWTTDEWGAVQATFTWTLTGHTGRGARVQVTATGTDGDAKWWGVDFAADGTDNVYTVSDWYRADVPTDLLLWVHYADGTESYEPVVTLPPAATWTQATAQVTVPDGAQRLRVLHTISPIGTLDIDDVSCVGQGGAAVLPGKYKATVTFTFDDGWLSAYNMLIPRLEKMGWRGTNFIITTYPDKPGYQSDYILSKDVKSLMGRCHEVASHTLTHPDLATLTTAQWTSEITDPIPTLKGWGSNAYGIAPPFGSYTPEILAAMAKLYPYMRTLHPDVNQPPYNVHELNGHVLTNISKNDELEELLSRAEQIDGGWIILVFHRASADAPSDAYVTPDQFQGFLDLVQKHGAKVETIAEHMGLMQCTPLPTQPTLVVGDKSLDAPAEATKATADNANGAAGCDARGHPQRTWPLVVAALAVLLWRRKAAKSNVRPH